MAQSFKLAALHRTHLGIVDSNELHTISALVYVSSCAVKVDDL
jgi:hypothetical protein